MIDFHTHCLPGVDDGAPDLKTTFEILDTLKKQGVKIVVATPHYVSYDETIPEFLKRRNFAYAAAKTVLPAGITLLPGAEIVLKNGLAAEDEFPRLVMGETEYFLLELPPEPFDKWMLDEIYNIIYRFSLYPIFAHIERYPVFYNNKMFAELLDIEKAVFQLSTGAIGGFNVKRRLKKMVNEGVNVVFGSDSHNMTDRRPDFDVGKKILSKIFSENQIYHLHRRSELFLQTKK